MPVCGRLRDTIFATGGDLVKAAGWEPVTPYVLRGPRFAKEGEATDGREFRQPVHNVIVGLAAHGRAVRITMLSRYGR